MSVLNRFCIGCLFVVSLLTFPVNAKGPTPEAAPAATSTPISIDRTKFGDWEVRCETPPGAARQQCALVQSLAMEDKPNVTLLVIALKTADGKARLLRVIAPLGVLLPQGLGLKLDQTDVGRVFFAKCLPSGCVAESAIDDKFLDMMSSAKVATFVIFETPEEGIGIPMNMTGLKEGFAKLP